LAKALRRGELVAVPTETVYGLAANALDPRACRAIFRAKGRPSTDPLIVHLHSLGDWERLCRPNEPAVRLAQAFWPGPLTMVLPRTAAVPDVVTAGRDSVAIRMPAHPLFLRLLRLAGVPLAAPSANPFGYVSPTTAEHVAASLGGRIRHILQGGAARIGLESTIIDLRDARRPKLLRPGAVTREALERVLGRRIAVPGRRPGSQGAQVAPGLLKRHYSPRTPVRLHRTLKDIPPASEAVIFISGEGRPRRRNVFWLDAKGDLKGAARRLFATLRRADDGGFQRIHAELAPAGGIGDAINDRLRRAAAR
jgi:L-threonylcarbamoyladenylate synthase